ncbi:MAG: TolC family protein [Candidatus Methylomirabilis oxygeniifera]|uniref:Putative Outer membrane efflux protein n=1 Tax=Methylomirabilis oxygeniifera TaxID=671143 RepID=D5MGV0_METO1|nr:MAG: TolC family protein [Candidatus Methylomirabilis oxyfera]CBE68981.1 putative Outer membrane efflux protein precursor [Candidatus Methylomirabilis oxyfera]
MRAEKSVLACGVMLVVAFGPGVAGAQEEARGMTLPRAIEIALEKSPLLQTARHRVGAAVAGVDRARAGFLPKLNLSESFTRSDDPAFVFSSKLSQGRFAQDDFQIGRLNDPSAMTNFRTILALSQPLYTGGKVSIGFEQAKLNREASAQGLDRTRQEVVFHVARAYDGVLLAQTDLEVATAAIQAAEANRDLASIRFETGLVVESDLLSADVRLARLQEQAITARNTLTLAKAALNDVMGFPLDQPFDVTDRLTQRATRSQELTELERLALERRPDYRRLGFEEGALNRGIGLAQAEFLPTVGATASYELNHLKFAADGRDSWFVGVAFQWNLFNGLEDRAKVAEAQAHFSEIQAVRTRMASRIRLETKEAFLALKTAEARIGVAQRAVGQAEEALRIVKDRYEAGLTTIVDLVASEAALTQSRGNLAQALYDHNVGLAALELAVGTIGKESF